MKKTTFFVFLFFLFSQSIFAFSDVSLNDPYYNAVKYAKEKGMIQGFKDGAFRPDAKISRAAFVKIIIKLIYDDSDIYGEDCFVDVKNDWYAKYVCTAKRMGFVKGYRDGTFRPETNISFADASKLISHASENIFTENANPWYEHYVNFLASQYAIPVSIDSVHSDITRAELVDILWRIETNNKNQTSRVYNFDKGNFVVGSIANNKNNNVKVNIPFVEIKNVDKPEIVVGDTYIPQDLKYGYVKDKNNIYYKNIKLNNVDYYSFEVLGEGYAKDNKGFFINEKRIEGLDIETFSVLKYGYSKDKDYVYYNFDKIEEADSTSFKIISYGYAKDNTNVYRYGKVIKNANPDFFEVLSHIHGKDSLNTFLYDNLVENLDLETFEPLEYGYSKDKNSVYRYSKVVIGADPFKFNVLSERHGIDSDGVYLYNDRIYGLDLETFEPLQHGYSKDKNSVYRYSKLISDADSFTFKVLDVNYSIDKNGVYYDGKRIDGADPESFDFIKYSQDLNK